MENAEYKRAGFGIRLGAILLDGFFLGIINNIISVPFLPGIMDQIKNYGSVTDFSVIIKMELLLILVSVIYWVFIPTVTDGKSFGKMIVGIQIIRQNGEYVSFGRLLLREIIGKSISSMIIFIGYFLVLGEKKLALHDMIANTQVVYSNKND